MMKTFSFWKKTIFTVAPLGILFPLLGHAGTVDDLAGCVERNNGIQDFLEAQGTSPSQQPPQGPMFFPPVPDMVAWTDLEFTDFALVDYAGVADAYVKGQPGFGSWQPWTLVDGSVLECPLPNGSTMIKVHLSSENALGFAQSIDALIDSELDFLNTPTTFGGKVQDVPSTWAFGSSELKTTFVISAPGAPLPDFFDVINGTDINGKLTYRPVTLDFQSATQGRPNDPSCLKVHQVAVTSPNGKRLDFSIEIVEIESEPCSE